MAICGPGNCDCAFNSSTLTIVRDGNIITIEQAEFSDITELQEAVANLQAEMALLPGTFVNTIGDTMTGALRITSTGQMLYLTRTDANSPHIGFYHSDGVTRLGYIQCAETTGFIINAEGSQSAVRFATNGTERGRFQASAFLLGKTSPTITTVGTELHTDGRGNLIVNTDLTNFVANKISSAIVSGATFAEWRLNSGIIGSITRNAATSAVLYNVTSDRDLKNVVGPVPDLQALKAMMDIEPTLFSWKADPDANVVPGYIAQQVAAAWPTAIKVGLVTPGYGDPNARTFDKDGNETTPKEVWKPWQMDHSMIVPLLHAAVQAMARKMQLLENRIEALENAAG